MLETFRIKAAKFPATKNLGSLDFKVMPSLNKMLVMEQARCDYITRNETIIAVGNSGTGKTHIALGLGLAACQKGLAGDWHGFSPTLTWQKIPTGSYADNTVARGTSNNLCVDRIVFGLFHKKHHIHRSDEAYGETESLKLPPPVMASRTRFHRNDACW